ncbi:MAG: CbiX/SirB N-terminal domain-containing protein [Burkholderiales bacterium]|jgi:sirohydrochlorin cobaltochelatase|nr:CbiX/SirB N-terminal domain-containing protein [Burkholderiales bacterium]
MPQTAVVLFAHGARSPEWSAPLHALQEAMRARGLHAELAFLELQPPSLSEVLDALAPDHVTVQVLPVFWAEAGHVRNELPAMLAAARARHPGVRFTQLPTLSQVPGLMALLADFVAGQPGRSER